MFEQIKKIVDKYLSSISFINDEMKTKAINYYISQGISLKEVEQEVSAICDKIQICEPIIQREILPNVLSNSIIFIGPMCSGKSTISESLKNTTEMPIISLDDREQLSKYYDRISQIKDLKDRELALVGYVLTEIKEPSIINFGAGHSIQENTISRIELERLISRFKNVVLLVPSKNKDISTRVLSKRIEERLKNEDEDSIKRKNTTNEHFIRCGYNERLAKYIIETEGKTIEECRDEIIKEIERNKNELER